jgi:S1/P1 Nuclease
MRIEVAKRSECAAPRRSAQGVEMHRNAALWGWLAAYFGLSLTLSAAALAWSPAGHETVGAIADQLISGRRAEVEVHKLLKSGESLQSVSVWADCAKGYCGELSAELAEFVRRNPRHAHYHYTDLPFQALTYEPGSVGTSEDDIVHILTQCIAVLKGATDPRANPHRFSPREALLLVVHLLGDIHQPLHVGTAYVSDKDAFVVPASAGAVDGILIFKSDGDNDLLLGAESLHRFWDSQAVENAMHGASVRNPAEFAQFLSAAPPDMPIVTGDVTKWPAKWATETLVASKRAHEGISIQGREKAKSGTHAAHPLFRVSAPLDYAQTASAVTATQLRRAGYRLAAVLEAVWH